MVDAARNRENEQCAQHRAKEWPSSASKSFRSFIILLHSLENPAGGLASGAREGRRVGHPLEIPEGRWKYETTGWRLRGCALWCEVGRRREREREGGRRKSEGTVEGR